MVKTYGVRHTNAVQTQNEKITFFDFFFWTTPSFRALRHMLHNNLQFLRARASSSSIAIARISYRDSDFLSVCPSVLSITSCYRSELRQNRLQVFTV